MYLLYFFALVSFVSSLNYHNAIDIFNSATYNDFVTLKNGLYETAFISAYVPTSNGLLDGNACNNIKNAAQARIGVEIYMTPNAKGTKTAATQAKEVINGLKACNINVSGVWIQVVQPTYWPSDAAGNLQFINALISTFKANSVVPNIFTNMSDWQKIVGTNGRLSPLPLLWYYNVISGGRAGETPPNFNDFQAFNGWTTAAVKQYAQNEQFNAVTVKPVNRDVYTLANGQKKMMEPIKVNGEITVGGNIV